MSDRDWFVHALALPEAAQFSAIVTRLARLARLDADGAVALWEAWREYVAETLGPPEDAHPDAFALHLRRGVERAASADYPHVAWVAAGERDPARVSPSAWRLLADDVPLTEATIRVWANQPGIPLVVERVRAGGAILPTAARGPFIFDDRNK